MSGDLPSLNAHESPPHALKELYKRYQKLKLEDLDFDSKVIDLSKNYISDDTVILKPIPLAHLQSIFGRFVDEDDKLLATIQDSPVYSQKRLPGLVILPALLPICVQRKLLSVLLHRDLSNARHKSNLHLHYDIPYFTETTPGSQSLRTITKSSICNSFFFYSPGSDVKFIPKNSTIHKPLPIAKVLEKSLRWITLGGQYDWTNKVYPNEKPPEFPPDIARLLEGLFPAMTPEAAIVNIYSPGDTLSLHRDVSEKSDKGLISISLGCDCLFVIGSQNASDGLVIRLRSGDAVYMSEDARFAWHGVPRILPNTCPSALEKWPAESGQFEDWRGWMSRKRINLNVRQMNN